ncbi:MAG: ribonuclease III [Planctomyces sp.]|nr:ribonuclease III [Planctomyces sp.]
MTSKDELLELCETRVGYVFTDRQLLRRCLTHSSSAETRLDSNERLEFLGDAILGLVICKHLFDAFPELREGQLTKMKSQLVSRSTCARVATRLQLNDLILVGKGLNQISDSILSDVVESLIAGIYVDGGFDAAQAFVFRAFEEDLVRSQSEESENYKSQLQEFTQRVSGLTPEYVVIEERGPDHAREFVVVAHVGSRSFESAEGRSKKEAEQQAARKALKELGDAIAITGDSEDVPRPS